MGTSILAVEDDERIREAVKLALEDEGWSVEGAASGEEAVELFHRQVPDVVLIDIMLPGIDGFEVVRRLREQTVQSPVLLLTARDAPNDRVTGLDLGADDYLTKPFSFDELLARLRALARRGPLERRPVLQVGPLKLDPRTRRAWHGEIELELSAKEFALLETFMRRPGEVLSRFELIEHAWDVAYENRSNVIDVYVRYLREKIDRRFGLTLIETVRGAGYRLKDGG